MPKLIATVGEPAENYTYGGARIERHGFLSIYSFEVSGNTHRNDLMERGRAVVVMPVDMRTRELYMIEQPRYLRAFAENDGVRSMLDAARGGFEPGRLTIPAEEVRTLEMPAGVIDGDERPIDAAIRELWEETGIRAPESAFEHVASYYPSVGGSTEHITTYLAHLGSDDVTFGDPPGDGDEQILVWKFTFDEAFELLTNGRIRTASCGLLLRELRIRDLEGRR